MGLATGGEGAGDGDEDNLDRVSAKEVRDEMEAWVKCTFLPLNSSLAL